MKPTNAMILFCLGLVSCNPCCDSSPNRPAYCNGITDRPGDPPRSETSDPPAPPALSSDIHMCNDLPYTGPPPQPLPALPAPPPKINPDGTVTVVNVRQDPLTSLTPEMWQTGSTLHVKLMKGSAVVRSKVRAYAEQWTHYANIKLDFVDESQSAEIRVGFDKGGSWSMIGRQALGVPFDYATMNFGWLDDTTDEMEYSRVVLHEFGHALGLVHEHQSPAAGIQWDKEKAYKYYRDTNKWDAGDVNEQVFKRYETATTNYSEYDPLSIMHYAVSAELTLNGVGVPWNTALSEKDIKYIKLWYPPIPSVENATGMLRTGDDCDEIDFQVEYGVTGADRVAFVLKPGVNVTWWKSIKVPIAGSAYAELEIQDGKSGGAEHLVPLLDRSRPIRFNKAKFLGVHTQLGYTWDVMPALPPGSRVTLTWKRDRC